MQRISIFIFICAFAAVFLASLVPAMANSPYQRVLNLGGQVGLGLSLIAFFIAPPRSKGYRKGK